MTPEFRAWDVRENKYVYDNFAIHPDGVIFILDGGNREIIGARLSSEFIIEQFTGKLDRHGKKIFEGHTIENGTGRVCKIEWCEYTGQWDATAINSEGRNDRFNYGNWHKCEITGTIHD